MQATQELMAEHRAILVALQLLEKVSTALAEGDSSAANHLGQLLDFYQGFVDRCHHAKEEDVLFPELVRRGVPREGGPVGVMLLEHEVGRGHVRAMAQALAKSRGGDAASRAEVGEPALAYARVLRAHIDKENTVLFPLADRVLPEDVDREMVARFEAIERDRVGEGKHEAYHAMLHALRDAYGVA